MFAAALSLHARFAGLPQTPFYARVDLTPVERPRLVHLNESLAAQFGLRRKDFDGDNFLAHLGGKPLPEHFATLAMAYCGHQFGVFNPALGDGRALLLGEASDRTGQIWEFQLKGSGPTPYSRGFDGRAVLRSVIREYLASEAIQALGIPTTRALCVVDSDTPVRREQMERAAMMIRLAPSHLRFGSFELFYSQGQHAELRQLVDHTLRHHFPQFPCDEGGYLAWFAEVVRRTACLVADWQAYGFCHGVMNTDNFSILGLTFDYGPFGFLERYEPTHICNHSDDQGRYAFDQQPRMAFWNCLCLAQALTPLIGEAHLRAALQGFEPALQARYLQRMRARLGLTTEREADSELVAALLTLLETQQLDYTRFMRGLCHLDGSTLDSPHLESAGLPLDDWLVQDADPEPVRDWLIRYLQRLEEEPRPAKVRQRAMRGANPKYILRNYLAQRAIEQAEGGDYSEVGRLLELLQTPFAEHPDRADYAESAPAWAAGLCVSCSS